jgi:hypothetical protein
MANMVTKIPMQWLTWLPKHRAIIVDRTLYVISNIFFSNIIKTSLTTITPTVQEEYTEILQLLQ